ncbi:hypothetical protein [Desulfobulbus sp.]|uniref:hypothetical protein n=1 Tax=Desulfobulbus sp. TaxID=895 RepID=UPI00286F03EE|nr:hypothetical protein [Desulfobulbus sp.]
MFLLLIDLSFQSFSCSTLSAPVSAEHDSGPGRAEASLRNGQLARGFTGFSMPEKGFPRGIERGENRGNYAARFNGSANKMLYISRIHDGWQETMVLPEWRGIANNVSLAKRRAKHLERLDALEEKRGDRRIASFFTGSLRWK